MAVCSVAVNCGAWNHCGIAPLRLHEIDRLRLTHALGLFKKANAEWMVRMHLGCVDARMDGPFCEAGIVTPAMFEVLVLCPSLLSCALVNCSASHPQSLERRRRAGAPAPQESLEYDCHRASGGWRRSERIN